MVEQVVWWWFDTAEADTVELAVVKLNVVESDAVEPAGVALDVVCSDAVTLVLVEMDGVKPVAMVPLRWKLML